MAAEQNNILEILKKILITRMRCKRYVLEDETLAVIKNLVLEYAENISENTIKPR